jgi:hypothetical protein
VVMQDAALKECLLFAATVGAWVVSLLLALALRLWGGRRRRRAKTPG